MSAAALASLATADFSKTARHRCDGGRLTEAQNARK